MTQKLMEPLDTIAESRTQEEPDMDSGTSFRLKFNTDATEAEVQALDTPD